MRITAILIVSILTSNICFSQKTIKYKNKEYNIGMNYEQDEFSVLSKNKLLVTFTYSFVTTIEETDIPFIHDKYGHYYKKYCNSVVRSVMREKFSAYTIEEILSSKREFIINTISNTLRASLSEDHIIFEKLLIESVVIPPSVQASMEEVAITQQEVIAAKHRLEKTKIELEIQAAKSEIKAKQERDKKLN